MKIKLPTAKKRTKRFAAGGDIKPWELYARQAQASQAPPSQFASYSTIKQSPVSRSSLAQGRPAADDTESTAPTSSFGQTAKRTGLGLAQGALGDPILAIAQMTGQRGRNFAERWNQAYEDKRKELGGEGFDTSRLGGNVAGSFIPGLGAAGKLAKGAGLVKQGAITGATAAALQPVISDPSERGQPVDPTDSPAASFWGDKAKQVGGGAVLGGALNKLIGRLPQNSPLFKNPSQLPATPGQLASQKPVQQLTDVEKYVQMFPDAKLTPGQLFGPRWNQLEQKLSSMPVLGNVIHESRAQALESQNVSMMNRALKDAGLKLDPGVGAGRNMFENAYEKLNKKYDSVLDQAFLPRPDRLRAKIQGTGAVNQKTGEVDLGVVGNRYQSLSEEGKKRFDNIMEKQLFERFGKDPSGTHSVRMTGRQFKNHEENLKELANSFAQGTGEDRIIGSMIKDSVAAAHQSMVGKSGAVGKELKALNKSYAQFKTLEAASTASGGSGGIFNPLQTIRAATKGNRGRVSRNQGLLQPESELSLNVLGRSYPDSGTAGRLMSANPAMALFGGAVGSLGSLLYNPRVATGLARNKSIADEFLPKIVGNAAARVGNRGVPAATRYSSSQADKYEALGDEEEGERNEYLARGGLVQYHQKRKNQKRRGRTYEKQRETKHLA